MDWILETYLKKKNEKPLTFKSSQIDIKKKDYDTIVSIVDNENDKPIITTNQKKR